MPPHYQKRGHKWVCTPTFGQTKYSNFDIFWYFVFKNAKFSWLASLADFTLLIFSKLSEHNSIKIKINL